MKNSSHNSQPRKEVDQLLYLLMVSLLVLLACNAAKVYGQPFEIGVLAGTSHYLGDIGGNEQEGRPLFVDLQEEYTQLATGLFLRYEINHYFLVRTNFYYGQIGGDDRLSANPSRNLRNLHFKSVLVEGSLVGELTLFRHKKQGHRYNIRGVDGWTSHDIRWYAFTGAGLFHFNPKAVYQEQWYELQPLGTEGQSTAAEKYKLTQPCIPVGIGLFVNAGDKISFGVEIGWRKTFTDYLDDVSTTYADVRSVQAKHGAAAAALSNRTGEVTSNENDLMYFKEGAPRGNPHNNDSYVFSMLSIGYLF